MGVEIASDEETLAEKNQRAFANKKTSCIIAPICLQTGILCSGSVCRVSTFVNKRALYLHEKMMSTSEFSIL